MGKLIGAGDVTRGRVTAKYTSSIASRYRGRVPVHRVAVRFRPGGGATEVDVNASVSYATYSSLREGWSLDVTYLPAYPRLASIEPTPWSDPVFLGLFGLSLVLLGLSAMVVVRMFVPPPDD